MRIITTISDLENLIDGWDQNGDLTREQRREAAYGIRDKAHDAGLAYGEDWEQFLNTITIDDVLAFAA